MGECDIGVVEVEVFFFNLIMIIKVVIDIFGLCVQDSFMSIL